MDFPIEDIIQSSTLELSSATNVVTSHLYSTKFHGNEKSIIEFSSDVLSNYFHSSTISTADIVDPSSSGHDIINPTTSSAQLWPSSSHIFNVTTTPQLPITTPATTPKQNNLVYYVGIPVGVIGLVILILVLVRKVFALLK